MKRLMPLCVILLISLLYPSYGKDCSQWIKAQLDSMETSYTITEDGTFKLEFPVEFSVDGRTQLVFIDSKTESFLANDVLEIWSPVFCCEGPLSAEIANMLLKDNSENLVGFWQINTSSSGKSYVIFKMVYDAENIKKLLSLYLFTVASAADDMEKKLTNGGDQY
ncbi:hypothetical protein HPY86_06995 [candidate division WOR-3 bacterium]|nr:hypothetical protein [candidate division WOR-3 bacterium]